MSRHRARRTLYDSATVQLKINTLLLIYTISESFMHCDFHSEKVEVAVSGKKSLSLGPDGKDKEAIHVKKGPKKPQWLYPVLLVVLAMIASKYAMVKCHSSYCMYDNYATS